MTSTKLYIEKDTPSYIMAEDQSRVFSNCTANVLTKQVDCKGQLPYKFPQGKYIEPTKQIYGKDGRYFNSILAKKNFGSHDECLNQCRHLSWCKFVITKCPLYGGVCNKLGTCYLYDVTESTYGTTVKKARDKYYITRFRDGEDKKSLAADSLEIVPAEQVIGFRGFMVKVYGPNELIQNYSKAHNGQYWEELKPRSKEDGSLFSAEHVIYQK